ncbi:MAG: alpha/beta hydrolase [Deltaproteobacteria bacterium]|nr:MAG: alpha/beta hydrolase [Deltaproteobacteria bacterium]
MPTAQVRDNLTLAYTDSGDPEAPVLVLVTGLGGLKEGWFRQVGPLSEQYRVITFDNRGMGGSSLIDEPLTIWDMAEDTVKLFDALEIERAHLFGVSMGGKICQELALTWPERVNRVVLGCTSAGEEHRVEGRKPSPLRQMQGLDADEFLEKIVPLLFGRRHIERNLNAMKAFARSRGRRPPNPRALDRQWEAYSSFDSWERLPGLLNPTLCITGDEDALCDWRNSERLVEQIPNSELYLVEGTGHSFHLEAPEEVNRVVAEFLG